MAFGRVACKATLWIVGWMCLASSWWMPLEARAEALGQAATAEEGATVEKSAVEKDAVQDELRRRMIEDHVTLEAGQPSPFDYISDCTRHFSDQMDSWMSGRLTRFGPWVTQIVTQGTRLLAVILMFTLAWLVIRRLRRQPWQPPPTASIAPAPERPERLGLDHWRSELLVRLQAQDGPGALRALWWWWACVLGARDVDPSWTTRELLQAAGRQDLRLEGRRFDFLAYGADQISAEEVHRLWDRIGALRNSADGDQGSRVGPARGASLPADELASGGAP